MGSRTFRATQWTDYPNADDSSLVPGQLAGSIAATALHAENSRTNQPDPRRNPPPVESAPYRNASSIRAFRPVQSADRPLNNEAGVSNPEPPNPYAFGVGNGGAPTGAPHDTVDEQAHLGYDPIKGTPFDAEGVGPKNYGNFSSPSGGFTDAQAHQVSRYTDMADPRRGKANIDPEPRFESSKYETSNTPHELIPMNPVTVYDKPQSWFHQGRPARKIRSYDFNRPFDQWAAHNMSGQKVRPTSPPSSQNVSIDATPRASLPIRTTHEDGVPGDAYNGPTFAAPGMQSVGPNRNTWRLQPQRWDQYLVVDPGVSRG